MNPFTKQIHEKGYTIGGFCEYWQISLSTYRRYCANEKLHDKLTKMIEGMK